MLSKISHSLFSLLAGVFTGLFALLILGLIQSVFGYFEIEHLISKFFINEIGEELLKFLFILFVLNLTITRKEKCLNGFLFSFLLGIGFGLFELFLIIFSGGISEFFGMFLVLVIHSATSLFLGTAIIFWNFKNKRVVPLFLVMIAIIIHLVYNSFVASMIHLP